MTGSRPHIVIDISDHGFGHMAQVAALVPALWRRFPDMRLTLRTGVREAAIRSVMTGDFDLRPGPAEAGFHMFGPDHADVETTARSYSALHADWLGVVAREAKRLEQLRPDLLVADIPYSSIAAAAEIGITAVALCSLNWADTYAGYVDGDTGAVPIISQIRAAYGAADLFLQPEPHMPMNDLANRRPIGPLARIGRDRRHILRGAGNFASNDYFVLASWGGIAGKRSADWLPRLSGVCWVVGDGWTADRADVLSVNALGLSFVDAVHSCDAVITKTGYGMFTEAVFNGTRVLYAPRPDWPEARYIEAWVNERGTAATVDRDAFWKGDFVGVLEDLLATPVERPGSPSGPGEAAEMLASVL